MSRAPSLAVAVLAVAVGTVPARGQIVRGQVREGGSDAPVEGAMVVLLEPSGHVARRVLTDRSGGFIVRAEHPGSYLIRVDRIGYESLTTERFDVTEEGVSRLISMPIKPVQLEGLEVGGSRRCALRNEQGAATARVWEETRKALEAAAWTLSSGTYRYTLLGFERDAGPDLRTLKEHRQFLRGTGQAPYVSYPAAELVEEGFVVQNRDRTFTYRAPDAEAFLSDEFLDTHCMSIEDVKDGLIGLGFQPIRGRRTTDIRGTLWIEAGTATLRKLEFRYVNLPPGIDQGNAGGEVLFGRLPNGTWIVREWSIRMPRASVNPDRTRVSITGYDVMGGVVWRVLDRDGQTIVEAEAGSISGTVTDSLEAGPVQGAQIRPADGTATATTGEDGSFLLSGLPRGLSTLEVSVPYLDSLRLGPFVARVEAAAGEVESVRVRLPGVGEILSETCADTPATDRETAPVLGLVTRGIESVEGTRVRVRWLGMRVNDFELAAPAAPPRPDEEGPRWRQVPQDARAIEANLDSRGLFLVCGVPTGSQLHVEVGEGPAAEAVIVTVTPGIGLQLVPVRLRGGGAEGGS